jgi:DNA-binding transcriptional regulator YiaG
MHTSTHDCEKFAVEYTATPEQPYHYVGSGLSNVYLVGVKYWICEKCKQQAAEIPALSHLLAALGRALVAKKSPLTGPQVRFLRKRLSRRAVEFAHIIGITPQRLSTMEATENPPLSEGRDKLVRFVYACLSGDQKLKDHLVDQDRVEKWLAAIHGRGLSERIIATWQSNRKWRVQAEPMALCA